MHSLRTTQDGELRKIIAEEISEKPKLLNPGKGTTYIKTEPSKLFPLADLRQEMNEELYLHALPEASMYCPSSSKKNTIAVTAKPEVDHHTEK